MLLTKATNGSMIFAVTPGFTNLDLTDQERFPGATNPTSPNYIKGIASYAFNDKKDFIITNLGDIDVSQDIEAQAFCGSSIKDFELKSIPKENAFKDASIRNLTVDFDVTTDNVTSFKNFINEMAHRYYDGHYIESVTFNKNAYLVDDENIFNKHKGDLDNLTFKGTTVIGSGQFKCPYLKSLDCSGPTEIGNEVFNYSYENNENYDGIQTLNLSGVTKIGENAITINPDNINEGVFTYPPSIQEMHSNSFVMSDTVRNSITSFSLNQDNTNYGVILGGKGLIDKNSKTLFVLANKNLTSVDFTDSGVETISNDTLANFAGCLNLEEVNLSGVKTIADGAFVSCPKLKTFNVPSSLVSISALAFVPSIHENHVEDNDTKIESITCVSNSKYEVDDDNIMLIETAEKKLIFMATAKSEPLDFSSYSDDIDTIAPYACAYHSELTSLDLTGIINVQEYAFLDCYSLVETFEGDMNMSWESTIQKINWGTVETIDYYAFTWNHAVYYTEEDKPKIRMKFPSTLKRMEYAFGGRDGSNGSTIEITGSDHPIALKEGALGAYDIKVKNTSFTNVTLTLPPKSGETGTWYHIKVNNDYDQNLLKGYVTTWLEHPEQFPIASNNLNPPDGITIVELTNIYRQGTEDEAVDYKIAFNQGKGWVYYMPSN